MPSGSEAGCPRGSACRCNLAAYAAIPSCSQQREHLHTSGLGLRMQHALDVPHAGVDADADLSCLPTATVVQGCVETPTKRLRLAEPTLQASLASTGLSQATLPVLECVSG